MINPNAAPDDQSGGAAELEELVQTLKVEAEGFVNSYTEIDRLFTRSETGWSAQEKDRLDRLLADTRKEVRRLFDYSYSSPQRNYMPNKDHIRKVVFGGGDGVEADRGVIKAGDRESFHLALEMFSAMRAMIVNEDTLINHRISWQIAIQGGIAFAFVHFHDTANYNFAAEIIILLAGIIFSVFCFVGVLAAFQAVKVFKDTLHNYFDVLLPDTEAMPRATGDRYLARRGAIVGYAYAILPGLLWLFIGAAMISGRLHPVAHRPVPAATEPGTHGSRTDASHGPRRSAGNEAGS
jgi:hypothetical protein